MHKATHRTLEKQITNMRDALDTLDSKLRDSTSPNERRRAIGHVGSALHELTRGLDECRMEIGEAPKDEGLTTLQKRMLSIGAASDRPRKTVSILSMLGPKEKIIKVCREEVADKAGVDDVLDLEQRDLVYLFRLNRGDGEYEFTEAGLEIGRELASHQQKS